VTNNLNTHGRYLPPSTPVRHDGLDEGGPEYGVIVYCWLNSETDAYDCYVAFFGDQQSTGKLTKSHMSCGIYQRRSRSSTLIAPIEPEALKRQSVNVGTFSDYRRY